MAGHLVASRVTDDPVPAVCLFGKKERGRGNKYQNNIIYSIITVEERNKNLWKEKKKKKSFAAVQYDTSIALQVQVIFF